jgi:hypothetical protein
VRLIEDKLDVHFETPPAALLHTPTPIEEEPLLLFVAITLRVMFFGLVHHTECDGI